MTSEERFWLIIVGVVLVIVVAIFSIYIVPAGNVGVVTRFGAIHRVAEPGMGLKIPFVERVRRMSVQTELIQFTTEAGSSNLQSITADISVNYRIIGQYATLLYQEVGRKYEEKVLVPNITQAFKVATSNFTAEETILRRDELSDMSKLYLQESMEGYYIEIQAFNIANIDFSDQYDDSIEMKQVQEQKVEIAKLKQEEARITAETIVIEAQAQADAQELLNNTGALSTSYLQYLFLTRWNGLLPEVYMTAEGTPVFDVGNFLD